MYWIERIWVWLSRMPYSYGFGIQSPNDYCLVRNVVNEHWPYYQYNELGKDDDALTRKLGKLYFRLANWWQPSVIASERYQAYLSAGYRKAVFSENIEAADFVVLILEQGTNKESFMSAYNKVKDSALLVVEGIQTNKEIWESIADDTRATIIFDLYYCGIVFFDKKRYKHYYKVNF